MYVKTINEILNEYVEKVNEIVKDNPDLEVIVIAEKCGVSTIHACTIQKVLRVSDLPYEIMVNFPYVESHYFYSEEDLIDEFNNCTRYQEIDVKDFLPKIEPYWKDYVVIRC